MKNLPLILLVLFIIVSLFITWRYLRQPNKFITVKITAYCPGACCNEKWAGLLADGTKMSSVYHPIVAADWEVLPYKTKIKYNGIIYEVRDVGILIKGNSIDILLNTHKEANNFSVKHNQVIEVLK